MKLIDRTLGNYVEVLKSMEPTPGGGSVSALAGASGAALIVMVADLTIGKEKYAANWDLCQRAKEEALELMAELTAAVDKDTDAFNMVAKGFKMPKETEEEKTARRDAIRLGTLVSTQVPYQVMEMSLETLKIADKLVGNINESATSDLGVAALNLKAAIEGAWLNVKINLPGIKDPEKEEAFNRGGQELVKEGRALAEEIYEKVLGGL